MTQYLPTPPPTFRNVDDLARYVLEQLDVISAAFATVENVALPKTYVEPDRKLDGLIMFADGASWNPGGTGRGIYFWDDAGSAWVKL